MHSRSAAAPDATGARRFASARHGGDEEYLKGIARSRNRPARQTGPPRPRGATASMPDRLLDFDAAHGQAVVQFFGAGSVLPSCACSDAAAPSPYATSTNP